tara:strand:+ start:191 stop:376 length:186 start_codon:yes stop_codon:yes gene_type:complete
MSKCNNCHHDCHCSGELHADEYGVCACENCECKKEKERAEDKTYETGGLVIDDTGECESCQ